MESLQDIPDGGKNGGGINELKSHMTNGCEGKQYITKTKQTVMYNSQGQ